MELKVVDLDVTNSDGEIINVMVCIGAVSDVSLKPYDLETPAEEINIIKVSPTGYSLSFIKDEDSADVIRQARAKALTEGHRTVNGNGFKDYLKPNISLVRGFLKARTVDYFREIDTPILLIPYGGTSIGTDVIQSLSYAFGMTTEEASSSYFGKRNRIAKDIKRACSFFQDHHQIDVFNIVDKDSVVGKSAQHYMKTLESLDESLPNWCDDLDLEPYVSRIREAPDSDIALYLAICKTASLESMHINATKLINDVATVLGHVPEFKGDLFEWAKACTGEEKYSILMAAYLGYPGEQKMILLPTKEQKLVSMFKRMRSILKCDVRYMHGFDYTIPSFAKAGVPIDEFLTEEQASLIPAKIKSHIQTYPFMAGDNYRGVMFRLAGDIHMCLKDRRNISKFPKSLINSQLFKSAVKGYKNTTTDTYMEIMRTPSDYTTLEWCMRNANHLAKVSNIRHADGRFVRFHNTDVIKYVSHEVLNGDPFKSWKSVLKLIQHKIDEQICKTFTDDRPIPISAELEEAAKKHPEVRLMRRTEDLRVEGIDMCNCVAGYAESCVSGKVIVVHIGGKKASEGVTVEIQPPVKTRNASTEYELKQCSTYNNQKPTEEYLNIANDFIQTLNELFKQIKH